MPEGDTVFRAARTLHRALAGRTVTRFESVFPRLTRVADDRPLRGRVVDRVNSRGKHLLIWFSGGLVLRTHLRMHGSWHIYRTGERWMRPRHDMRIVLGTDAFEAVAFDVPAAELLDEPAADEAAALRNLGPDLLADDFDVAEAIRRLSGRGDLEVGDALLDQSALAGIGNIFKSETLFASRVNPFVRVNEIPGERLETIVTTARNLLRASAAESASRIRLNVYGRAGTPCRRCGTVIVQRRQGPNARSTYWCTRCQAGI